MPKGSGITKLHDSQQKVKIILKSNKIKKIYFFVRLTLASKRKEARHK